MVEVSDLSGFADFHCKFSALMLHFDQKLILLATGLNWI